MNAYNNSNLSIDKLEKYIKILADNYQLKFKDVDQNTELSNIINYVTNENEKGNQHVTEIILKEYRPSQLVPYTIGSFLFGCLQQTYGDVPMECSPLCSYGITNQDNIKVKRCTHQIYVQYTEELNNRFYKLNECESRQGYLFVHINFMGITKYEREMFRDNGVFKLHILVTYNSKHHTIIKMRDIDDLPLIEEYDGITFATKSIENLINQSDNEIDILDNNDNTYMYVMVSIAVIIMIVAIYNKN